MAFGAVVKNFASSPSTSGWSGDDWTTDEGPEMESKE